MKLYYFVDHTSRYPGFSGVQRVVRGLARSLLEVGCEVVFVAWDPQQKALVLVDRNMLNNIARHQGPLLPMNELDFYPANFGKSKPLHEYVIAPLAPAWLIVPEVTHITFHAEPPTQGIIEYSARHGLKTAFIFYDAIPLKHPDYADAELKHSEYMQQLALADLIIPISRFAADDLVSFFLNRLYFQVETLPQIAPLLLPTEVLDRERSMPTYSGNPPKLVLVVGTVEPRKNQLGLLHAFQRFCDQHPEHEARLVLVGGLHPAGARDVLKAIWKNEKVKYVEYVDDKELNNYYTECDFTVFPSVEEGYGLPIVESLWFGKPCLCADFGSMGEVAEGGGCLTVDTKSPELLYGALSSLLLQPDTLNTLKDEIKTRKFTTWRDYGLNVKQLLEREDAPSSQISRIYYWVDHTRTYPSNSGIQRVVRGLAFSLQNANIEISPVGWDIERGEFVTPSDTELTHLEKWNGPAKNRWNNSLPVEAEMGSWLLIPELLTYPGAPDIPTVIGYARKKNMRAGIVFFDAIPYKLKEIYPIEAQHAHAKYMCALSFFDKVLCISEQSKSDLLSYLRVHLGRMVNVEQRIKAILLPAEFAEIERQTVCHRIFENSPVRFFLSVRWSQERTILCCLKHLSVQNRSLTYQ
ncbi:MAG: glycosyltransferase [Nitrosomonadales bacterium]